MLRRWSVKYRENGLTEVVNLMEREWSCYGGAQFNGVSMVMSRSEQMINHGSIQN